MRNYETKLMDKEKFAEFTEFFDKVIGTDYVVNEDPDGSDKVYCVCIELNSVEVSKLQKFEKREL